MNEFIMRISACPPLSLSIVFLGPDVLWSWKSVRSSWFGVNYTRWYFARSGYSCLRSAILPGQNFGWSKALTRVTLKFPNKQDNAKKWVLDQFWLVIHTFRFVRNHAQHTNKILQPLLLNQWLGKISVLLRQPAWTATQWLTRCWH